jgi:hypothetical protein
LEQLATARKGLAPGHEHLTAALQQLAAAHQRATGAQ